LKNDGEEMSDRYSDMSDSIKKLQAQLKAADESLRAADALAKAMKEHMCPTGYPQKWHSLLETYETARGMK
jgi:Tfp pilus assembly protein FimV